MCSSLILDKIADIVSLFIIKNKYRWRLWWRALRGFFLTRKRVFDALKAHYTNLLSSLYYTYVCITHTVIEISKLNFTVYKVADNIGTFDKNK